jgi:hypothetical protein
MRRKSLYSPPIIYFYSKLHGLSRARNESIAKGKQVKKCKQRVTMLVFYAHFILKTQDLQTCIEAKHALYVTLQLLIKQKAFRSEQYLFSELHASEGRTVRRNACRSS